MDQTDIKGPKNRCKVNSAGGRLCNSLSPSQTTKQRHTLGEWGKQTGRVFGAVCVGGAYKAGSTSRNSIDLRQKILGENCI